ncbi:MAG: guanylate kinase [Firmicutes bacterium]|nr:guanylate kinase [Bacillota bacterium]
MTEGILLVISGPSGVGKGTLCKALREGFSELCYSISATTRAPRPGEQNGVEYLFLSPEEFEAKIERDEFLEWAFVYENYYGTPRVPVEEALKKGKDIVLEIDMQGALQIKERFPEAVFVYLLSPSLEEQRRRIERRGTENPENMNSRLEAVKEELKHLNWYDYVIVNDEIADGVDKLKSIITAEKCRVTRNREWLAHLVQLSGGDGIDRTEL